MIHFRASLYCSTCPFPMVTEGRKTFTPIKKRNRGDSECRFWLPPPPPHKGQLWPEIAKVKIPNFKSFIFSSKRSKFYDFKRLQSHLAYLGINNSRKNLYSIHCYPTKHTALPIIDFENSRVISWSIKKNFIIFKCNKSSHAKVEL